MRNHFFLAALALLAACGGQSPANNATADDAPAQAASPDNAMADPTNMVVPLPPATATPVAVSGFPAAFQGRWGLTPNDCDPKQDFAAKGLIVVAAESVKHYESRATAAKVEIASPTKLTAELAYSGEGQQWTRRATWTLLDAGKTLFAETDDPEPPMRALRYARCPA